MADPTQPQGQVSQQGAMQAFNSLPSTPAGSGQVSQAGAAQAFQGLTQPPGGQFNQSQAMQQMQNLMNPPDANQQNLQTFANAIQGPQLPITPISSQPSSPVASGYAPVQQYTPPANPMPSLSSLTKPAMTTESYTSVAPDQTTPGTQYYMQDPSGNYVPYVPYQYNNQMNGSQYNQYSYAEDNPMYQFNPSVPTGGLQAINQGGGVFNYSPNNGVQATDGAQQ